MSSILDQKTLGNDTLTPIYLPLKAPSKVPLRRKLPHPILKKPSNPFSAPQLGSCHQPSPITPTIDPYRYLNPRLHPEFEPQYPLPISAYDVRLAKSLYNRIPEQKQERDREFLSEGEDSDDDVNWRPEREPVEDFSSAEGIREGGFQSWR